MGSAFAGNDELWIPAFVGMTSDGLRFRGNDGLWIPAFAGMTDMGS